MINDNTNTANKPTVLAVGLFVSGTGFTRVFETLFAELSRSFAIHWMGIGYKGPVTLHEHYTLHPVNVNGGDIYGAYGAAALASTLEADNVLLLTDFYLLKNYGRQFLSLKERGTKLLAYVPLDGYFTNHALIEDCLFLDELVLYNHWALREVKMAAEKYVAEKKSDASLPALSYIFHGTDTYAFVPDNKNRKQLKADLFKVPDAAETIFILNANRHNERKNIAATITAFSKALPGFHPPVYLCLHTPNLQPHIRENLLQIIEYSGCKHRILLNPLGEDYCSNEMLANLYTACDIGVNTSLGEGWGMISFEHAACGGAQLVPGHTAPAELWKDAGIIVPIQEKIQLNTNPFLMYHINSELLAAAMIQLVNDDTYLKKTASECFAHVKKNIFSWKNIACEWKKKLNIPAK